MLETSLNHHGKDLISVLNNNGFRLEPFEQQPIFNFENEWGHLGYIESISDRYWLLHSTLHTKDIDQVILRQISKISQLDRLWLSGEYYLTLWNNIVLPQWPNRVVRLKFESESRFEQFENELIDEEELNETEDDFDLHERKISVINITETAKKIEKFLPSLQRTYPAFKSIKMLRIPGSIRGGYEFWSWGKVTHRSPNFREGRDNIISITNFYAKATEIIENLLWLDFESTNLSSETGFKIRGAPLVIEFDTPLSLSTFRSLIYTTFDQGKGPLRLWGNPIWLGDKKVHVYGVDLHLWQRLYIEFTPKRILAFLPQGTCGNTAHRLVTNIQSYIDPNIKVTIAGKDYKDVIKLAFNVMG